MLAADAAASFLAAPSRAALEELAPVLRPMVERTLARQQALLRRCRVEADDVVQRVFERMLTSPPTNPSGQEPLAVLGAWSRTVALNYLLDLARRTAREVSDDVEPVRDAPQERELAAAEQWQLARKCADHELVKYKYLRELFYAVASEPDVPARVLAERIGLLAAGADEAEAKRAEQYVWKLRERVQARLADYLERAR